MMQENNRIMAFEKTQNFQIMQKMKFEVANYQKTIESLNRQNEAQRLESYAHVQKIAGLESKMQEMQKK